jgi:hypothetical protein
MKILNKKTKKNPASSGIFFLMGNLFCVSIREYSDLAILGLQFTFDCFGHAAFVNQNTG